MKLTILLSFFLSALFLSCSTAYRTGQTPDDLYYTKGKVIGASETEHYVRNDYNYEDATIRMAAHDPRWRTLNDYSDYNYTYNPYAYGYNYGYYYNPYYYPYPVYSAGVKFVNPKNTTIRSTNLNTYNNNVSTYTPTKNGSAVRTITVRGYNVQNNDNNRAVDYNNRTDNNNNNSNNNNNNTSGNNNSSGSNSSTGNSSSGSSISRPSRGN